VNYKARTVNYKAHRTEDCVETPERRRLVDAVRQLTEEIVTKDVPAATLRQAADLVENAAAIFGSESKLFTRIHPMNLDPNDPHAWFPFSPVIGRVSPLAAPVEVEVRDGHVHARMHFGTAYEGPPGCVHGAMIAAVFDEVLGAANIVSGTAGMTGTLTVRYHRPTPLHADLTAEGWTDRVDGRKIYARGEIRHDGEVTASCEGVFIAPDPAKWADHFPDEARGF